MTDRWRVFKKNGRLAMVVSTRTLLSLQSNFDCITGVEVKIKNKVYPILIDANHIPDLTHIETTSTGIRVGASVTLTSLNDYLKNLVQTEPGESRRRSKRKFNWNKICIKT